MTVSVSPFLWCTLSVPIVLSPPHTRSEGSGGVRLTARVGILRAPKTGSSDWDALLSAAGYLDRLSPLRDLAKTSGRVKSAARQTAASVQKRPEYKYPGCWQAAGMWGGFQKEGSERTRVGGMEGVGMPRTTLGNHNVRKYTQPGDRGVCAPVALLKPNVGEQEVA